MGILSKEAVLRHQCLGDLQSCKKKILLQWNFLFELSNSFFIMLFCLCAYVLRFVLYYHK